MVKNLSNDEIKASVNGQLPFVFPTFWLNMTKDEVLKLNRREFVEANALSGRLKADFQEMIADAVAKGILQGMATLLKKTEKGGK